MKGILVLVSPTGSEEKDRQMAEKPAFNIVRRLFIEKAASPLSEGIAKQSIGRPVVFQPEDPKILEQLCDAISANTDDDVVVVVAPTATLLTIGSWALSREVLPELEKISPETTGLFLRIAAEDYSGGKRIVIALRSNVAED